MAGDPPTVPSPSGEEEAGFDFPNVESQVVALVRALRMQRGFGLYFVSIRQAEQRRALLADLAERLPELTFVEVFLREPETHLLGRLRQTLASLPAEASRPVLCVYGVENWLGGVEEIQTSAFVTDLNATRNAYADALNCPLVFCVPEHILVGITRGAPDFFSVRSGVYFLDQPVASRILPSASVLLTSKYSAILGAGVEGRRQRAAEWEELLNGYHALPIEKRDVLAEAKALNSLGEIHFANGDYGSARPMYERALAIREANLGPNHQDTAVSLNNLALLHAETGNFVAAKPLFARVLAITEITFGSEHFDIATALNNIAWLSARSGDYESAKNLFTRALVITEAALGSDHPNTATSLNNLATLYVMDGEYAKAKPVLERALSIREATFGSGHPMTALIIENMAWLNEQNGDYSNALSLYKRAISVYENTVGLEHPTTRQAREYLSRIRKHMTSLSGKW